MLGIVDAGLSHPIEVGCKYTSGEMALELRMNESWQYAVYS